MKTQVEHESGCSVHNMPAYPAGPCDCGADEKAQENAASLAAWDKLNAAGKIHLDKDEK